MNDLPESFLQVMQEILQDEYEDFLAGFTEKRHRALRLNPLRTGSADFVDHAPFSLRKVPWVEGGYFYDGEEAVPPSKHPYYAAGVYYLQEPSAMTPASRLPILPGDRVLDLCAAPGGKATSLGAALAGKGLLVANDINKARAKALLHNIELFGIANAFVTNEPPRVLLERFPEYFDKIMVDAPCSGEGMFRKNPAVIEAWMEKGPEYFSGLQRNIILCAADMLRPGGLMFYSTCTFSPLENEAVISHLLRERPDMEVLPMEDYEGFAQGLTSFRDQSFHDSCRLCRRIWPHRMEGEGHFLALLGKKGGDVRLAGLVDPAAKAGLVDLAGPLGQAGQAGKSDPVDPAGKAGPLVLAGLVPMAEEPLQVESQIADKKAMKRNKKGKKRLAGKKAGKAAASQGQAGCWWTDPALFGQEEAEALDQFFSVISYPFEGDRIRRKGDRIFYVPGQVPDNAGIHFLRNGVLLGKLKKSRFEPAQSLALILSADSYGICLSLPGDDPRLARYLRGETLELTEEESRGIRQKREACRQAMADPGTDGLMKTGGTGQGEPEATGIKGGSKGGSGKKKGAGKDKAEWVLVLADRYPLGFGRLTGQVLKNKYPAGWRQTSQTIN